MAPNVIRQITLCIAWFAAIDFRMTYWYAPSPRFCSPVDSNVSVHAPESFFAGSPCSFTSDPRLIVLNGRVKFYSLQECKQGPSTCGKQVKRKEKRKKVLLLLNFFFQSQKLVCPPLFLITASILSGIESTCRRTSSKISLFHSSCTSCCSS